jgi:tRNA(Ile)-lysidine synthase TilS/MesJ
VRRYAKARKLRFFSWTVDMPDETDLTCNPDSLARMARRKAFGEVAGPEGTIMTAHQASDKLIDSNDFGGVRFGNELRPLLTTSKDELKEFLLFENIRWRKSKEEQVSYYKIVSPFQRGLFQPELQVN